MPITIQSVRSDDGTMLRSIDGAFIPNILMSLIIEEDSNSLYRIGTEVQIKETTTTVWRSGFLFGGSATSIRIKDIEVGSIYNIRVRHIYSNGVIDPWKEEWSEIDQYGTPTGVMINNHTVQGNLRIPPDLTTFIVEQPGNDVVTFKWTFNWTPVDLVGVELRYGTSADWDSMTYLAIENGNFYHTSGFPEGNYWFAARPLTYAVDPADATLKYHNYSNNPSYQELYIIGSSGGFMLWKGVWNNGEYHKNDVVTQAGWLAIANKTTEDVPAPQPVGDPIWVEDDVPSWTEDTQNTNILYTGQRYTYPFNAYLKSIRFWVPAGSIGTQLTIWLVTDPLGNPNSTVLIPTFTVTDDEDQMWNPVPQGLIVIPDGTTFDIVMVQRPTTGESSWNGYWDYKRSSGDPGEGEIYHQGGGAQMRIHKTDENDVDQTTNLEAVQPGDTIAGGGITWTVLSVDIYGDHVRYDVEPNTRASEEKYTFTFTSWAPLPIPNVEIANYHSGNSNVQGLISTSSYPDGITLDQNAYGVDIQYQEMNVSDDWDFMAYSGQ